MNRAIDYLAAAAIHSLRHSEDGVLDSPEALRSLLRRYAVPKQRLTDGVIESVQDRLLEFRFITKVDDIYAGSFFKYPTGVKIDQLISQFKNSKKSEEFSFAYDQGRPLFNRVIQSNQFWEDVESTSPDEQVLQLVRDSGGKAPASDRIVRFSHNEQIEIESPLNQIIETVEKSNEISDAPDLRELILSRLKAGREMVKVGISNLDLIYMTLIVGLRMFIEKYRSVAIGAVASKLLDMIINHVGYS